MSSRSPKPDYFREESKVISLCFVEFANFTLLQVSRSRAASVPAYGSTADALESAPLLIPSASQVFCVFQLVSTHTIVQRPVQNPTVAAEGQAFKAVVYGLINCIVIVPVMIGNAFAVFCSCTQYTHTHTQASRT